MASTTRPTRLNRKAVSLYVLISVLFVVGIIVGHQARKRLMTRRALTRGLAACERREWPQAVRELKLYLAARPADADVLGKYARAQLAIRPLEAQNLKAALNAYRQLLQLQPEDPETYERLAALYFTIQNFDDLAYLCESRLKSHPGNLRARLWLARVLAGQRKSAPARTLLAAVVQELDRKNVRVPEYVESCLLLSSLAETGGTSSGRSNALSWLDRAIRHDPRSVEARLARARLYRIGGLMPDVGPATLRARALADLERADALNPSDPRVRLVLSAEWMELGHLDRAAAGLNRLNNVSRDTILACFTDYNDWITARFLQESELMLKMGNSSRAEALVAETLSQLKNPAHRLRILPAVVRIHLAANNVAGARRALQEYLDTLHFLELANESPEKVALLQAQVAAAEKNYYRVINLLEPLGSRAASRSAFWGLLAEAYGQTNQPRRAVRAAAEYLKSRPGDPRLALEVIRILARQGQWARLLEFARDTQAPQSGGADARILCLEARIRLALGHAAAPERPTVSDLLAEATRLQKNYPTRADVRRLKAQLLTGLGRIDAAEAELLAARRECADTLAPTIQLASFHFSRGRSDEGLKIGREACRDYPRDARAWVALSELQKMSRRYPDARATLETGRARVSDPEGRFELSVRLALLLIQSGDRPAGTEMLSRMAGQYPTNVGIRSLLVSLPEVRSRPAAAQKWVEEIRALEGETGLTWRLCQASLWITSEQWPLKQKEAADLLNYCTDADPAWTAPVLALGGLYERQGQWPNAEGVYRRLLSANPAAGDVVDRLVTLLENQKRFSDAREVLDRSLQNPADLNARRIQNALRAGDMPRAMDELDQLLHADPANANSRVLMARLTYAETHDAARAVKYLDEADALTPHSLAATGTRVAILRDQGRLEEAQAVLAGFKRSGDPVSASLLTAEFLAAMGKLDQAEREYRQLVEMATDSRGYEHLGEFYTHAGRLSDAIDTWRKGTERFPGKGTLSQKLVEALLLRGAAADRAEATARLDSLQRQAPDDPDLIWIRALLLLAEDSPQATSQARRLLERVVSQQPTADKAHLKLIQLALHEANFSAVRDLAIRALAVCPDNTSFILARARAEIGLRNFPAAVQMVREVLKENPADPGACGILVEAAVGTHDPDRLREADEVLREAARRAPDNDRLRVLETVVLRNSARVDEAVANLEAFRREHASLKDPAVLLALSELYRGKGNLDASGRCIRDAGKMAPNHPLVMRERILWLGARKQYADIPVLLNQKPAGPINPGLLDTASAVLVESGLPEWEAAAIPLLDTWLVLAPQSVDARLRLAWVLFRGKHYDRAEEAYRHVLAADPGNAQAVNNLAWLLSRIRGKHEEALALISRAVRTQPRDIVLRDTRGTILSQIPGRLRDAEADFQSCAALAVPNGPEQAKALANLARTSMKLGDTGSARARAQEALRIDRRQHVFSSNEKSEMESLVRPLPATTGARKS